MKSIQGLPLGVDLLGGTFWGKMAKNCMKITKSTFWEQNSGWGEGRQANFSDSGWDPLRSANPAI